VSLPLLVFIVFMRDSLGRRWQLLMVETSIGLVVPLLLQFYTVAFVALVRSVIFPPCSLTDDASRFTDALPLFFFSNGCFVVVVWLIRVWQMLFHRSSTLTDALPSWC
jgi:hypothetical protein